MPTTTSIPWILFALDRECSPFRKSFPACKKIEAPNDAWICSHGTLQILLAVTGIGPRAAQRTLAWLEQHHAGPPFVVMAGYAGALSDDFRVGDVLVATEIIEADTDRWIASWPDEGRSGFRSARLLTTGTMIGTPMEKRRLGETHGAHAVDMEAATVARFCSQRNIPFGCVRAVSDDVETALSPALVKLLSGGQVSIARVLLELVRRPTLLPELIRLGRHTRTASATLAQALGRLLGTGENKSRT